MSNVAGLTDLAANALLDTLLARIDAGSGPGVIAIYTSPKPATANAAATGTLLGTLTFTNPAGAAANARALTFSPITEDSAADADGTAFWARVKDSAGVTVFDCDVSDGGGSGMIKLNTVAVVMGGPIRITSFVLAM